MSRHPLLAENESKRLEFRLPLLICFALYSTWQMALIYFSGQTLSLDGRAPLPVDVGDLDFVIAAGYLLSIGVMIFLPRFVVRAERIAGAAALLSVLALFLPLGPDVLALMYYIQCFCGLFMIGFEAAILVNLFTEKALLKHILLAYGFASLLTAVLQNDVFRAPFTAFRLCAAVILALMLFFFFKLPASAGAWPRYAQKGDGFVAPKSLIIGIFFLVALNCFATLFGVAVAESVPHGVSAYYTSSAVFGCAVFLVWRRFGVSPLKSGAVLIAVGGMGFIAAMASRFFPALALIAPVLLGAGMTCLILNPYFVSLITRRYPSKYIVPAYIGVAFVTVLIHSALLDALRANLVALFAAYLVITVALLIVYLLLAPYLLYASRGRSVQEIVEAHNEAVAAGAATAAGGAGGVGEVSGAGGVSGVSEAGESDIRRKLRLAAITPLTPREYEVAEMTVLGIKQSVIANALNILPGTVNNHRSHIYSKFGVANREELLACLEKLSRTLPDKET